MAMTHDREGKRRHKNALVLARREQVIEASPKNGRERVLGSAACMGWGIADALWGDPPDDPVITTSRSRSRQS